MNNLDRQYQALLQYIINHGTKKQDRTGTGTISVFGRQIRHKMSEGFPLLTTKKMAFKTMATELIWFLRGDTNIKFLVDNNCHIWDGDCYQAYLKKFNSGNAIGEVIVDEKGNNVRIPIPKDKFIEEIKLNSDFAKKFGELGPIYGAQWRNWDGDAYANYSKKSQTKIVKNDDGTETHISPASHYNFLSKEEFINKIKTDDEFAKKWGAFDEDASGGIDQITNLIRDLKTNPDSRRLMVNAWNVGELDSMVLPPCHYGFQVYTRELSDVEQRARCHPSTPNAWDDLKEFAKLTGNSIEDAAKAANIPTRAISLMWNQRSVDTFLGLPFNIASYGLLLEIIAKAVNMVPDELIGNLGDTHLYLNHIEQAEEQMAREPYELPKLNINTEFWPTESGECGVGPIDAIALFDSFKDEHFCKCLLEEDIQLSNYYSHPTIKAPLSN